MNSLLYYYNNVQKMAAYRQAKRMQRGVLTAQGGFSTKDPALLQMPCTIQCVFVAKEFRSENTQILFDTRGDSVGPRIDITPRNNLFVASNYTSISKPAILDKIYDVVFAVSKDSTDVYIDGEKEATLASGEAKMTCLNLGANSSIFYGDWLMYRQFNYLMSADEVKALDNNCDPMGYVVPKAKRDGLLAEYLPQNLMYGRDDKTIATSWLDGAKQMPLSDEYMEPLFQSIGGYDMAANGAPEILYRTYDYRGVKLGENQSVSISSTVKFVSNPITIGTDDFSVEFYGTMYGSNSSYASLFNAVNPSVGGSKTFSFYPQYYPDNGIYGVLFSPDTSGNNFGDQVVVGYKPGDDSKFLVTVTRQGTTVKVYINGELKATKEQSEVKDLGDLQLAIANSSDVGFVRVWNKCLSDSEVSQLENSGDPAGYVLPAEMKTGDKRCIAEYLAMNLVPQKYKPTVAARWLDSATVLPDPDGTLRRIWKSVGGYDMEVNGNPIILQ